MTETPLGHMHVTVLLSSGLECDHIYALSGDSRVAAKIIKEVMDQILLVGKNISLYFDRPMAIYHPQHVMGIRYEFTGSAEIEELVKAANERLGFRPPGS